MRVGRNRRIALVGASAALVVASAGIETPLVDAAGPTTFSNTAAITILDAPVGNTPTAASLYPSPITVSGMTGVVSDVDVTITGFSHAIATDVDILVVAPGGSSLVLFSDPGATSTFVIANNANITFDDSAASGVPQTFTTITGTVSYRPTDNDAGGAVDTFPSPAPAPGSATTLSNAFTGTNPNGTWQLFVVDDANGDVGSISGGWSLTVTTTEVAAPTVTTLTSVPNPSQVGNPVTFTATVTSGGSPVTAGTVSFTDGAAVLASNITVDAAGTASLTTSSLNERAHSITATYNGTSSFLTSNGSLTQVVDNATTTPSDNSWCNTGQITVPSVGPSTPYPSHITVSGAGTALTQFSVELFGVGHAVPVDVDILLVGPTGANSMLVSDVGGTSPASGVNLTFSQTAASTIAASGPLTSGTFLPSDDDTTGADTFPAPAPIPQGADLGVFGGTNPNGVWSLYVLDDATADAGGIAGGWCVNATTAAPTTTALMSSLNPSTVGATVTFTATVTSGAMPVTAGAVQFADGAAALGGAVPVDGAGQATLTTSAFAVGTHSISAVYAGAPSFQTSTGSLTQVVDKMVTVTVLTSSLNPSTVGAVVTFTATVTSGGAPVTGGSVDFSDGATPLGGAVPLDAAGQATMTTSVLTAGSHTLQVAYGGTASSAASGATLTQVVGVVPDAGGPYSIPEGAAITLDATASNAGVGATYSWDVNDDAAFGDATGQAPTLSWSQLEALGIDDGTGVPSTVTVRVVDGTVTADATTQLTVTNVAPSATLGNDGPVAEGSTATVTFSAVTDPSAADAASLTYSYDFDNDGTFELTGTAPTATVPAQFLADGPGARTVRAVVADDDGGNLALTTEITITNAAPTATIDGPSTTTVGVPVTLKVGAVDPSTGDMAGSFTFTVDWGDGSAVQSVTGPADPPVSHTYLSAGTFTVTATATDRDGMSSPPTAFAITVAAAPTTTTVAPTTPVAPTTTVAPATTTTTLAGTLPSTGNDSGGPLIVAILLVLGGAAIAILTRRQRGTPIDLH